MQTEIWTRNPFEVEAVRVTEENICKVADWCGGTVAKSLSERSALYVAVEKVEPTKIRINRAYIGNWILRVNDEFRCYTDSAFKRAYQPKVKLQKAVREFFREQDDLGYYSFPALDWITSEIMKRIDKVRENEDGTS